MTSKPKIKRLCDVRPKLSPKAKRLRTRYTRVERYGRRKYRTLLKCGHQEFEVRLSDTDRTCAVWFADQLAIALARLVEREQATGTTGEGEGKAAQRSDNP